MTSSILGVFTLDDEIRRFHPGTNASGRRAETLVKSDGLQVVLITMNAGATLHEHAAPGPITIHPLEGRFSVVVEGQPREVGAGTVIAIQKGVRHAVTAAEDGAFLLTIGSGSPQGDESHQPASVPPE